MEENQGYKIRQSVQFENQQGFALGENKNEQSLFVTWRFSVREGRRDYYWGHYYSNRGLAEKDFNRRVNQYQRQNRVKEMIKTEIPETYQYYSTQRPVDLYTYPFREENPMIDFKNYDSKIPVERGAFQAWGELFYSNPLTKEEMEAYELRPSRNNRDVRLQMEAQAQIVGKWEDSCHVPEEKRLTSFYEEFSCYMPEPCVTPEQLVDRISVIEMLRENREYRAAKKSPIASQMKAAGKLAEKAQENREASKGEKARSSVQKNRGGEER